MARYAETTNVPVDKSRTDIERVLKAHGAKRNGGSSLGVSLMTTEPLPERTDLDVLLERGESVCGEHRKVWPDCAPLHRDVERSDLPVGQQSKGDEALAELVTRVNGFVYAGDRLNAVVEAVRHLRADPALASRLLDAPGRLDRVWWLHRCVPGNPALTWFSHLLAAGAPRPERCPSCGVAASDDQWLQLAPVSLPKE